MNYNFGFLYLKVKIWIFKGENGSGDCCLWDGIKCDKESGYVSEFDFVGSCLYGIFFFNSIFFSFIYLKKFNFVYNDFNFF